MSSISRHAVVIASVADFEICARSVGRKSGRFVLMYADFSAASSASFSIVASRFSALTSLLSPAFSVITPTTFV